MNGVTAAQDIFRLLEIPLPQALSSAPLSSFQGNEQVEIRFEQVSFTYPGREDAAVRDVSFTIRPGEQVALVGESGAGKSTIAQLLMGFIRPQDGRILAGDVSIGNYETSAWRQQITWIPQAPYLFNTSLGANIALGNPGASPQAIRSAAQQAYLEDLIDELPDGLDTPVGEQGDAELQAWLEESVQSLCRNRTTLVIAHRLPTVIHSDRILVVKAGRIVESGDHQGLLQQNGIYATLIRAYGGGV